MCVYSMVVDHYLDEWGRLVPRYPRIIPQPYYPDQPWPPQPIDPQPEPPSEEEMKRRFEELKRLLDRAKKYDKDNNEPNCEMDSKKAALKEIAKQLGIEISFP